MPNNSSRLKNGGKVAACCVALVGGFEGLRQSAYQDVVGVWTVCYGETQGVKAGDHYTQAECKYMLQQRLENYAYPIEQCLPGMPDARFIAFVSLAYNIGATRACNSTAAQLVRTGKINAGCDAMMKWNRAGGVIFPGLTKRRQQERALCKQAAL